MINKDKHFLSLQLFLGNCQVQEKIGSSPIAHVYRIEHPKYGQCLLKHLRPQIAQYDKLLKKISKQLQHLHTLEHPNVAKVYEWEMEKHYFFLRELVLGSSLRERIKETGKIDVVPATQIMLDLAISLLATKNEIAFKNIKSRNIIVLPGNIPRLVDVYLPPNDPEYIAPELWNGEKSDLRSDIYALGITYFEMLCGETPFSGLSGKELNDAHSMKSIPWEKLPDLPSQVTNTLKKMLSKFPENRFEDPIPLVGDLREVLKALGSTPNPVAFSQTYNTEKVSESQKKAQELLDKTQQTLRESTMVVLRRKSGRRKVASFEDDGNERSAESTTQRLSLKTGVEEIALVAEEFEADQAATLHKISEIETYCKELTNPIRIVQFPKSYEKVVLKHLQEKFHRQTWYMQDTADSNIVEVEIDLEQGSILYYYFDYKHTLEEALEQTGTDTKKIIPKSIPKSTPKSDDIVPQAMDTKRTTLPGKDGETDKYDITLVNSRKTVDTSVRRPLGKNLVNNHLVVTVDYSNVQQILGWIKFVQQSNLIENEHFVAEDDDSSKVKKFTLYLSKLKYYRQEQENIAQIKSFFEGDYDIVEMDKDGMGMLLKLTAKNDGVILSLRPENKWIQKSFEPYIRSFMDESGNQVVYAELPKGAEFVVKVAFSNYEETITKEALVYLRLMGTEYKHPTIVGVAQQGKLFKLDEASQPVRLGYYLMLEYASMGSLEKIYKRFPNDRVTPLVGFCILYSLVYSLKVFDSQGIVHRDIQPKNILFDKNGMPKLSDFAVTLCVEEDKEVNTLRRKQALRIMDDEFNGLFKRKDRTESMINKWRERLDQAPGEEERAKAQTKIQKLEADLQKHQEKEVEKIQALADQYRIDWTNNLARHSKFAGSVQFSAPEQFCPKSILGTKCDIYQLGATLYTIMTGKAPVEGSSTVHLISRVLYPVKPKVTDSFPVPKESIKSISELVHRMMTHEVDDRISLGEVENELQKIYYKHQDEFREPAKFIKPLLKDDESKEKWATKVKFAEDLHQKCQKILFEQFFPES